MEHLLKDLRIGSYHVRCESTDDMSGLVLGSCHPDRRLIQIRESAHDDDKPSILLHEAIHMVVAERGVVATLAAFGLDAEQLQKCEEAVVETLTNGLVCLFRDNPHLIYCIMDVYPPRRRTPHASDYGH